MTPEEEIEKLPQTGEIVRTRKSEFEVIKLLGKGGFGKKVKVFSILILSLGAVFEVKRGDEHFAIKCEKTGNHVLLND